MKANPWLAIVLTLLSLGGITSRAGAPLGVARRAAAAGPAPATCGPGSGTWSQVAAYPIPIYDAAVAAQGNAIYSFGGIRPYAAVANAYRYDLATQVWTRIADLPAPSYGSGAVSDGTYLYILGGTDNVTHHATPFWRYDPVSNTYTTLAPAPLATVEQAVVFLDGRIYRIAGTTGNGPVASVDLYTVGTNTWAAPGTVADYPLAVFNLAGVAAGGYLYAAGGDIANGGPTAKTYRYDLGANRWDDAPVPDLPEGRMEAATGLLNGRWILAGGFLSANGVSALARDPRDPAGAWAPLPPLPTWLIDMGGAVVGSAFYAVGGQDFNQLVTQDTQRYAELPCPTATPVLTPTPGGPPPTATVVAGCLFSAVCPSDYFFTPVQYLVAHGAISGYADGTFRPYASTTRAQMVKIVVGGFGLPAYTPPGVAYTFADVPRAFPFFAVIEAAVHAGVVSGYTCDATPAEPCDPLRRPYFRPYAEVTRGQLSKIVVGAAGWPVGPPAQAHFRDVPPANPFYEMIETAYAHGILSGYADGTFRPGASATRGQIAKIVYGAVSAP